MSGSFTFLERLALQEKAGCAKDVAQETYNVTCMCKVFVSVLKYLSKVQISVNTTQIWSKLF